MQLEHSFDVPVPVEDAWAVLLDVERIAPCMPGAVLEEVHGDSFSGRVEVKVGPITVTYAGTARFLSTDPDSHVAVIDASGKETAGTGTAAATVTTTLTAQGSGTRCNVSTDLAITGKPAQFGRGVMADVGGKLIGQFATCLAEQFVAPAGSAPAEPAPLTEATAPEIIEASVPEPVAAAMEAEAGGTQSRESAPIDLISTARGPVLRRLAPATAATIAVLLVIRAILRRLDD